MISKFGGVLALCLAAMSVSGCQGLFPEEEDTSIGALRLARAPDVASSQRVGEDGFPLLGAFPGAAAPQLTDAQVLESRNRYNRIADRRARPGSSNDYAGKVARARQVRKRQARAVNAAVSANPPPTARQITGADPDEVLREIRAEGERLR